jgi:hypothetical protein
MLDFIPSSQPSPEGRRSFFEFLEILLKDWPPVKSKQGLYGFINGQDGGKFYIGYYCPSPEIVKST